MARVPGRAFSVALVLSAALADARGAHELAFYLLVGAVPAAAIAALSTFGDLVEMPGRARGQAAARLDALLSALALLSVLVGAAARGQASDGVPPLAASALVACVAVFVAQALLALFGPAPGAETLVARDDEAERVAEAA